MAKSIRQLITEYGEIREQAGVYNQLAEIHSQDAKYSEYFLKIHQAKKRKAALQLNKIAKIIGFSKDN